MPGSSNITPISLNVEALVDPIVHLEINLLIEQLSHKVKIKSHIETPYAFGIGGYFFFKKLFC